jgi:hypothetical protein
MADTKSIGKLVKILNGQIESGVELFKKYKRISKIYLKTKMDIKKNINNKLEEINERRKKIAKRKINKVLTEKNKKLSNILNSELQDKRKNYEKISESTLVDNEKFFLKEKEKIRVEKKKILSNILQIGKQIKSYMSEEDFKEFIDRFNKRKYEVLDGKKISFVTLMKHLSSGEISEQVAKTTKQIDELMTTGNVVNRKKKMEIGILKKEIENLLIDYDTTMKSLQKLAAIKYPNKKNITNEDIESLLKTKYSKKNSPEFRQKIYNLASKLKKYNSEVKTKMQKLKKLEASS